jgi:hypothetical protein
LAVCKTPCASGLNKQNESRNDEVGVFGKSINTENTLRGRIHYKRRGTAFYGFNPLEDDSITPVRSAKTIF